MSKKATATAAKNADDKQSKMKAVKKEEQKQGAKALSISEKVQQVKQQAELVRQREDLLNYEKELDSFKFGADSFKQKLTVSDGEQTFETTKTEHLELVVEDLLTLVKQRIESVEKQIL